MPSGPGFPQTSYGILCAIWSVNLIWENVQSSLKIVILGDLVSYQTYVYWVVVYNLLRSAPTSWLNLSFVGPSPVPNPSMSFNSSLLSSSIFFSTPLALFLSSFFPLLSLACNVPCLDFNGMCTREVPRPSITQHTESFLEKRQDDSSAGLKWFNRSWGKSFNVVSVTKSLGQFYSRLPGKTKWKSYEENFWL